MLLGRNFLFLLPTQIHHILSQTKCLLLPFASIANDGIYQKPTYYTKVLDRQGNILLESVPSQTRIIKSSSAALLTNAMEDVISSDPLITINTESHQLVNFVKLIQ